MQPIPVSSSLSGWLWLFMGAHYRQPLSCQLLDSSFFHETCETAACACTALNSRCTQSLHFCIIFPKTLSSVAPRVLCKPAAVSRANMASTADRAFWPPIQALFDFTLLFEDTILKILPSGLAVVLSPAVVGYYFRQPVYVQHSPLLWLKLVCPTVAVSMPLLTFTLQAVAFCLVGIEITALVFQCQIAAARTSATIAAASLDVALALVIGLVLFAEHKHAIRTSAFLGLYLALGAVIDATRSRSYFLRPGLEIFGYLSASAGATRLALSIPEEIPKQVSLPDGSTEDLGKEATSGYWSRTIFLWLNSTLWLGFRTILSLKDLGSIGPEFSSKKLYARFQSVWKETKSHSRLALAIACLKAHPLSALSILPPRLMVTLFTFSQPYISAGTEH